MSSSRDSASSSIWIAVDQVELPDKKYFKIGEVANLVGVEPHVLRYWQTQFPQVRPQKSRSGHRLYRRKDVETLLAVRELLHVQRFTIAGARQALRSLVRGERTTPPQPATAEAPQAPAQAPAPAATQTRAQLAAPTPAPRAVRVEAVQIEALEREALGQAMDEQLAARNGDGVERVEVGIESAVPQQPRRARARADGHAVGREQLGFGFAAPNRAALESARAEVIAMLGVLDREDAAAPQLRAPPAKS
jgi:DNA-binding transcriptional MerR regulator